MTQRSHPPGPVRRARRLNECALFCGEVLAPRGYARGVDGAGKGFGHEGRLDFWIVDGEPGRRAGGVQGYGNCTPPVSALHLVQT